MLFRSTPAGLTGPASQVASRFAPVAMAAAAGAGASIIARDAAFSSPTVRQMGKDLYKNSPTARAVSDTMLKARETLGLPSTAPKEFQRTSATPTSSAKPSTVARDTGITGKPGGETGVKSDRTVSLDRPGNPGATGATSTALAPKSSDNIYSVKRGDTLSAIAKRTGTSVSSIASANKIAKIGRAHV